MCPLTSMLSPLEWSFISVVLLLVAIRALLFAVLDGFRGRENRDVYVSLRNKPFPNLSLQRVRMEFPESNANRSVAEFQAVILAGYGNALAPLTNDHGDDPSPKSLLPIANKPMISFPLAWLDEAGLTDVLLICPHSHRPAIAHYVHSDISSSMFSSLRIDIQSYEDDEASSLGTVSILRKFANRIKTDFVLLPCDFVPPPSLPLSVVLNTYRTDAERMMVSTLFYEVDTEQDKSASEQAPPPPLLVYDRKSATILHVDYNDDAEEDELELRMRMLWKYPSPRITTRFADSHVYVCRRSILAVLTAKLSLESIREDLIPFLCKVQYRKGKGFRWEPVLRQPANNVVNFTVHRSSSQSPSWRSTTTTSRASSAPTSPMMPELPSTIPSDLRCGIVLHTIEQGIALRVNNLKAYTDINWICLQDDSPHLKSSIPVSDHIDAKAQVSSDSIIGPSTRIGERSSIKKSIVGQHCIVGKNVRISGCVLMDHVIVEDGAKIDGCIIGRNTRIGSKADLSKTVTQPGYEVQSGAIFKGEKLDTADWDPTD